MSDLARVALGSVMFRRATSRVAGSRPPRDVMLARAPPLAKAVLGGLLFLAGTAWMVFHVALLLIGDCSEDCRTRGEHLVVVLLAALGALVALVGSAMMWRIGRAGSR